MQPRRLRLVDATPGPQPGPAPAHDAWVRRHLRAPWRFLLACGCPADLADDLVQEAMLAALHKGVPELEDADARAWLIGAARQLWRAHLRRQGVSQRALRARAELAQRALQQCAAHDDGDAFVAAVRACLTGLDGRARRAVELRYLGDASRDVIAEALGIRIDGVKSLLRRTLDLLRQCVQRRLSAEQDA